MFVNMRSNDAFVGLPSDLFAFTMIQEVVARSIGAEVGRYKHCVGSLHLYDKDRSKAEDYLEERWQSNIAMPPMPLGDPWPDVHEVLAAEERIRNGSLRAVPKSISSPYWADIVNLLRIFERSFKGDNKAVGRFRRRMSTDVFDVYIDKRRRCALKVASSPSVQPQRELFKPH
jgi:thymidylate synthase